MIPFALPRRLVSVLAEETTLPASVMKWTTLASAVGVLAGTANRCLPRHPELGDGRDAARAAATPVVRPSFRRLHLLLRAHRRAAWGRPPSKL